MLGVCTGHLAESYGCEVKKNKRNPKIQFCKLSGCVANFLAKLPSSSPLLAMAGFDVHFIWGTVAVSNLI